MQLKKITTFTLLAIVLIICSLTTISAADQTINDTSTGGILQGITDTGTGDTLYLNPGTYNKTNQDTNITINKNITIQGNGPQNQVIIDAQGLSRHYVINNVNVTFINITFINGYINSNGGSIYNSYTNGTMKLINCIFKNNYGSAGGAIFSSANLIINNSTFLQNRAGRAGAIYSENNNIFIMNSNFTGNGNDTTNGGGAIFFINNNINDPISIAYIINTVFDNNLAFRGGGLWHYSNIPLYIINSTFTNNIGFGYGGGGIEFNGDSKKYVINSTFINNTNFPLGPTGRNGKGGAILIYYGDINIINSTFIDNSAINEGGAVALGEYSIILTISNSTFVNNTANYGGAVAILGGAVNNTNSFVISIIQSCIFINNTANYGGGIYIGQGTGSPNLLRGNSTLYGNFMSGNIATILGNFIYNNGTLGVLNLTFIDNSTWNVRNGSTITLYATLTDDMGNKVTGQNISFYLNGVLYQNIASNEGLVEINYTVIGNEGDLITINGSYLGIGSHEIIINEGQIRIIKIITNSTVSASNITIGENVKISGVAVDEDGNVLANVELNLTIDGVTYTVTTNDDGEWNLTYTPSRIGNFEVEVSYLENNTHYGFVNSTKFTVTKIATNSTVSAKDTFVGKTTTIKGIARDANGNFLANTKLSVLVDGKVYTVTTNSLGEWNLAYTPTHTGNIRVQVKFSGDDNYNSFTNTTTLNAAKRNIIVKITVKENKDGSITILANATYEDDGSPVINHPVDFILDGKIIGTGITNKNGIAKLKIPANKINNKRHKISVIVNGDDNSNDGKVSTTFTRKNPNSPKTNNPNKTRNNPPVTAAMKETGIPINLILLVLLSCLGIVIRKTRK